VQHRYGLNIGWHDRDSLLDLVPALNAEGLIGGTFSPDDGHCSSLLTGHALYKEAERLGAEFVFNEAVTGIEVHSGRVRGVTTTSGRYSAAVVVNAAGAWAAEIGALVGEGHPISPDSHEAGITEPVQRFLGPMVVDIKPDEESANYYFYQLRTGQVVFCITPRPLVPGFDRRETSAFLPLVARRMVGIMPSLANIRVRRTWRGLYPMTPDGSPIVGWSPAVEGYLLAIGMCGQGFMLGPGLGELLARVVSGTDLSSDDQETLEILSPTRDFEGTEHLK
jgi:sarcosine oxidase subunit beta